MDAGIRKKYAYIRKLWNVGLSKNKLLKIKQIKKVIYAHIFSRKVLP